MSSPESITPHLFAEVVLPIPMDRVFHYTLPSNGHSPTPPAPGTRVNVPFGQKKKMGVVVGYSETPDAPENRLKAIDSVLDSEPILDTETIDLARWISRSYACSLGEAVFSLLPAGSKSRKSKHFPLPTGGEGLGEGKIKSSPSSSPSHPEGRRDLMLTLDQQKVLGGIETSLTNRQHSVFLLWGVAAAGKTEIYMKSIERALSLGGGVIYLVPEISLTAQVLPELESRFPGLTVVWHSGVSLADKRAAWGDLRAGRRRIVLGARSGVVAPVRNLALVVVDEEHDPLYKEDSKPRYHAREVALERARRSGGTVILGSATPSLESYRAALEGRFQWVELPERVVGPTPALRVIDMRNQKRDTVLSDALKTAIAERLRKREQSILFLNRRGFYTFCICPKCGWVLRCPSCDVPAVVHKGSKKAAGPNAATPLLRCHYCVYRTHVPEACSACHHAGLWMGGMGTERVFSEIEKEFPWANVIRWDLDAVRKGGAHGAIFEAVKEKNVDIIVGTRMVSQGLDLPGVTLVGVVDADVPLHRPDFRAAERTFQLLVQAAGRSGRRNVQGEVIIQTRQPDHPALQFAGEMNYRGFAEAELKHRQELGYPPYGRLIQIVFSGRKSNVTEKQAQEFLVWAGALHFSKTVQVLGPAPAQHARRAGRVRFQILLKGDGEDFEEAITAVKNYQPKGGVRLLIDVDPQELR